MIRHARLIVCVGLAVALGAAGSAAADGVSENAAFVDASVKPKKLGPKKWKPIELFSGVRTETNITGFQSNPVSEYISYPRNGKFDFNAGDVCSTLPPNGSTPEQARAACPEDSYIGAGHAEVWGPGNLPVAPDLTVSVFRGPDKRGIQLHTYSPTLLTAAPTVQGHIVKSNAGKEFGDALVVPHAPETGALMITSFHATVFKSSKAILGRCKDKTMTFQRRVTYADGSSETAEITQRCKRKKK
jgi:hypothetical protein